MRRLGIRVLTVAILSSIAFSFFAASTFAAEATLSLSPATGSFGVGDTISIKVMVDGGGAAINAAEADLTFDKSLLSVSSVGKDGSAFSLWTIEPTFSNSAGTIKFGGGNPKPFTAKSTLVTIKFKALKAGSAKVEITAGSVLAADGKGTDILSEKLSGTYELTVKEVKATPPPSEDDFSVISPSAPVVKSSTHTDPSTWYNAKTAKFSWDVSEDVTSIRYGFDKISDTVPIEIFPASVKEAEFANLASGTNYFHIQFRNKGGWGQIMHRKTLVDVDPPKEFTITIQPGASEKELPSLVFETTDDGSGLKQYEITFGQEAPLILKPEEVKGKPYLAPDIPDGNFAVLVRASDFAGNITEAKIDVLLSRGVKPPSDVDEEESKTFWEKLTDLMTIPVFLVLGLTGSLGTALMKFNQHKKSVGRDREVLKTETEELRSEVEKIFSALHDEVEEQITGLDNKPRLGENEQKVLDKLREALDISEQLIAKEIEDVVKRLK